MPCKLKRGRRPLSFSGMRLRRGRAALPLFSRFPFFPRPARLGPAEFCLWAVSFYKFFVPQTGLIRKSNKREHSPVSRRQNE